MAESKATKRHLIVCKDAAVLASKGAERVASIALESIAARGIFAVALSGGSTPRAMFSVLAEEPLRSRVPWESTFVFWSDERTVPPDHPDSNYRMAYESLISRVHLPEQNIHRMRGELDPQKAADLYEGEVSAFFGTRWPRFDLVLLGIGEDGHTASLFPGTAALNISDRQIVANFVPKFNTYRLTMSLPAINAAAAVTFLVSGRSKSAILREVMQHSPQEPFPCQRVAPVDGEIVWMTDRDAVSSLDEAGLSDSSKELAEMTI